ncbi:MAG: hypothetical protein ACT4OO_16520 [Nitrospiraceae bacterium]
MLPDIQPTGRHVELPVVVVMKFAGGKIAHVLVQVGLLDPKTLPVIGADQAQALLDTSLSLNRLIKADKG